jgi:integrase
LRQNIADNQNRAQEFATHLNDYKAMREDLDHLEAMHRAALDRQAKLQASEQERAPRVELLEAAAPSRQPWRPDYRSEAALAVGGSVIFGLFATWLVDFLSGPRQLAPTFVQYSWAPALAGSDAMPPLLAAPDVARLPPPAPLPRELTETEIAALFAAATEDARVIALLLLSGMSVDEIVTLRWDDVDPAAGAVRIGGDAARILRLHEPARSLLGARRRHREDATGAVLRRPDGGLLTHEEVARLILFAAYDAGLDRPQEVTADALRSTYLIFLLRQGIRAADIGRIAGGVPQNELVAYMQLHSPVTRRPIEQIECVLPVLREITLTGIA